MDWIDYISFCSQNTHQRIRRLQRSVVTLITLVVYTNGWRERTLVHVVAGYVIIKQLPYYHDLLIYLLNFTLNLVYG